MFKRFIAPACVAAALLSVSPAALAQNETANATTATDPAMNTTTADPMATNTADPMATTTMDPALSDPVMMNTTEPQEDDDDFPWGLLGLLGLAGLLGLKRRDDRDVHVDARRDTR